MAATTVEVYKPQLTSKAREKIRRLEEIGIDNVVSIAYGMLLLTMQTDYIPLKEIKEKYNNYLKKFSSKFYLVPGFGPSCSLENKLEKFVEYHYVERQTQQHGIKYKLTEKGQVLLRVYIDKQELLDLFS